MQDFTLFRRGINVGDDGREKTVPVKTAIPTYSVSEMPLADQQQ